ncbi:ABC transporter substrate-binding protein [Psychroserpens sp. BH13MA-6]
MMHRDQLGRPLQLQNTPKRIVSLVPSQTELLVDLGLRSKIVGVTKFCVHPNYLKQEKNVVGGTKTINFDKVKALSPDIILCNKEENTAEMISVLEQIAPVHISDIYNLEDAIELIKLYGTLFSVEKKASQIIETIESEAFNFSEFMLKQPKRKVAYFIWKNPWMVAASQTFINAMLHLNNFDNVFADLNRYPEIKIADIGTNCDIILLSTEPYPFKEEDMALLQGKFPSASIILVDGEYFSWYGSRLTKAFQYFKTLHQDLVH